MRYRVTVTSTDEFEVEALDEEHARLIVAVGAGVSNSVLPIACSRSTVARPAPSMTEPEQTGGGVDESSDRSG